MSRGRFGGRAVTPTPDNRARYFRTMTARVSEPSYSVVRRTK